MILRAIDLIDLKNIQIAHVPCSICGHWAWERPLDDGPSLCFLCYQIDGLLPEFLRRPGGVEYVERAVKVAKATAKATVKATRRAGRAAERGGDG